MCQLHWGNIHPTRLNWNSLESIRQHKTGNRRCQVHTEIRQRWRWWSRDSRGAAPWGRYCALFGSPKHRFVLWCHSHAHGNILRDGARRLQSTRALARAWKPRWFNIVGGRSTGLWQAALLRSRVLSCSAYHASVRLSSISHWSYGFYQFDTCLHHLEFMNCDNQLTKLR